MKKSIHDPLTDMRIDIMCSDQSALDRHLKMIGAEPSPEGYSGLCFNLERDGIRWCLVWIDSDIDRRHLPPIVAHETLHLLFNLHRNMGESSDASKDGLCVCECNEETYCFHYDKLFGMIWDFVQKASESAEGKKDTIKA